MSTSKKMEIIYHNGKPDGIRLIRRHLSTITTYVIPRTLLNEAKEINGINRSGIYYLIYEKENKIAKIYVGQTRNGITRLENHNRSKDFWNKAIMFLSDKKTFTLDIISGLEEYAIIKARESKRYEVENTVNPKYEIDEYDYASIEEIYEEIKFTMATIGYKMDANSEKEDQDEGFHTTKNGIKGIGNLSGEKFDVLEGSEININKETNTPGYNRQREELLKSGGIVFEDGKYILKVNLSFDTPSGAAQFVLGGSQNGWTEWKNKDGITLSDIVRKNN